MKLLRGVCLLGALLLAAVGSVFAGDATPFYATTVDGLDGKPLALEQYRGKPVIVNFWARWCPPCRKEIPELIQLQNEYGKRGLVVLGLAIEEDAAAVKEFAKAYEINYTVGVDKKKGLWLMQSLGNGVSGLPFTLIIGKDGQIVQRKIGQFTRKDFDAVADSLLK